MKIATIDPSLRATCVWIGDHPTNWIRRIFGSQSQGRQVVNRIDRVDQLAGQVIDFIAKHAPEAIVIEGYSFGSKNNREYLAEFGGILRLGCLQVTSELKEIAPTALKLFVASKGNASKEEMKEATKKRWDLYLDSFDEVDAHGLYQMARCCYGLQEPELDQWRAIQKVDWAKTKEGKQ